MRNFICIALLAIFIPAHAQEQELGARITHVDPEIQVEKLNDGRFIATVVAEITRDSCSGTITIGGKEYPVYIIDRALYTASVGDTKPEAQMISMRSCSVELTGLLLERLKIHTYGHLAIQYRATTYRGSVDVTRNVKFVFDPTDTTSVEVIDVQQTDNGSVEVIVSDTNIEITSSMSDGGINQCLAQVTKPDGVELYTSYGDADSGICINSIPSRFITHNRPGGQSVIGVYGTQEGGNQKSLATISVLQNPR